MPKPKRGVSRGNANAQGQVVELALDVNQLRQSRNDYVEALGALPVNYTKTQLNQVFTAVDDWCTSVASAYNSALPAFFRSSASNAEKSAVLAFVAMRRAGR